MTAFPQIGNGSIAQLPVMRSHRWRDISNVLESNERVLLPDRASREIRWRLSMRDLSDAEARSLTAFFTSAQGRFSPFLFADPMANLLGWSEDFVRPDWQSGLITCAPGAADPVGTRRASTLTNSAGGPQLLQQTLNIPAEYIACFSAWVRSGAPGTVSISRDGLSVSAALNTIWRRIYVSGRGVSGSEHSAFSLLLSAGQRVDVWGLQVEAQPFPSKYKRTAAPAGIYEQTYFSTDELEMTNTAPGLYSCELSLVART